MRAAIRGDFERLAERRGSQELMREDVADDAAATPQDAAEPGAPAPAEPRIEPEPEVELTEAPPEPELTHAPPDASPEPEPGSAGSHGVQPAAVATEDAAPTDAAPEDSAPEDAAPRKSWLARVLGL